ncbi:DUF1214 domain-containing protein [Parasedimentitalea huanghaiensis]|uniref:DUF1214 domain-containing protein n=1 Tax=Parasedimentitalea huanghaiensis TaxID=2682100 RepID=UPI003CC91B52
MFSTSSNLLAPNNSHKKFWSVVACDLQTQSKLQPGLTSPSRGRARDNTITNDDRFFDLQFGPYHSKGEANWIETVH